jgi:hypothetical protein
MPREYEGGDCAAVRIDWIPRGRVAAGGSHVWNGPSGSNPGYGRCGTMVMCHTKSPKFRNDSRIVCSPTDGGGSIRAYPSATIGPYVPGSACAQPSAIDLDLEGSRDLIHHRLRQGSQLRHGEVRVRLDAQKIVGLPGKDDDVQPVAGRHRRVLKKCPSVRSEVRGSSRGPATAARSALRSGLPARAEPRACSPTGTGRSLTLATESKMLAEVER